MIGSPRSCQAVILEQQETEPGFFTLRARVPADFPDPAPGQFVHLRIATGADPLLPRPYGIVDFGRDARGAWFELYYGVVGAGTRLLARLRPGDEVGCLGPLGHGYEIEPDRGMILVAGGRGVAPLLMVYAAGKAGRERVPFVYGVRTKCLAFGLDRIEPDDLHLASDDGSIGLRGTALDALARLPAATLAAATLYACGPEVLLRKTALFALERGIPCQVSLESPFACGVGICRGCAVPAADGGPYLMCCSDGPVFEAGQIRWEAMP